MNINQVTTLSLDSYGSLVPPLTQSTTSTHTVGGSPTRQPHSAQASPTNTLKPLRPRAKSADESGKKIVSNVCYFFDGISFKNIKHSNRNGISIKINFWIHF